MERNLLLFAVGKATGELARAIGFISVYEGSGGSDHLAPMIKDHCAPQAGPILHLAGDVVAGNIKEEL